MTSTLRTRLRDSQGASAVEYALLIAAVATVIVAIVFTLGTRTQSLYYSTDSCNANTGVGC